MWFAYGTSMILIEENRVHVHECISDIFNACISGIYLDPNCLLQA